MKVSPSPIMRHRYGQGSAWEGREYRENPPIVKSEMIQIASGSTAKANSAEEIIGDLKSMNRKLEEEKTALKLEWRSLTNQHEKSEKESDELHVPEPLSVGKTITQDDECRDPVDSVREPTNVSVYGPQEQKEAIFHGPAAFPLKKAAPSQKTVQLGFDPVLQHRKAYDIDDDDTTSVQLEAENEKLKREWEAMKHHLARAQEVKTSREKLMVQTKKVLATSYSKSIAESEDDDSEEDDEKPQAKKNKNRSKTSHKSRSANTEQSSVRVDDKRMKKRSERKYTDRKRTPRSPKYASDHAQQIPMSGSETVCIDLEEIEVHHSFSSDDFSGDSRFSAEKLNAAGMGQLVRNGVIAPTGRISPSNGVTNSREYSADDGVCGVLSSDTRNFKQNKNQSDWLSLEPLGLVYKSHFDETVAREAALRNQVAHIQSQAEDAAKGLLAAELREKKLGSTMSSFKKKITSLTEAVEELRGDNRELGETTRLLSQEKDLLQDQTEQQRQALATFERQLEAAGAREMLLRKELKDSRETAALATKDSAGGQQHVRALNEVLEATKLELGAALDKFKATREENQELRGMGRHQEEMKTLMEKVQAAMKDKLQQYLQKIETMDSKVKAGAAREASLEKDLASAKEEGESTRRQLEEEAMMRQNDMEGTILARHADLEAAQERIVALEKSLEELREANSQEKEAMLHRAKESQEALESLGSKLTEVSIREALLKKEVSDLTDAAQSKEKNLEETERKLKETEESFSNTQHDLEAARERIAQLEAGVVDLEGITDEVSKALYGQLDEEKTRLASLENELGETRNRSNLLNKELTESKETNEMVQNELERVKSQCRGIETKLITSNGDLAATRERVSMMTNQNNELRGKNSKLEQEKEGIIAELKVVEKTLYQKNMEGLKALSTSEREASEKLLRVTLETSKKAEVEKAVMQGQLDKAKKHVWHLEREIDRLKQSTDELEGQIVEYVKDGERMCGVPAGFLGMGKPLDQIPSLDQAPTPLMKNGRYKRKK